MLESFFSNSTKSAIVSVLGEDFPLTAKQLFNRLIKEKGLNVTYQAVHKAVNELEEKNIVLKKDLGYVLSEKWISNLKQAVSVMEKKYHGKSNEFIIPENFEGTLKFHFDDYNDFCVSVVKLLISKKAAGSGSSEGIGVATHLWWPFKIRVVDFILLGKMALSNVKSWAIVRKKDPLDKFVGNMYLKAGFEGVLLGVEDLEFEDDFIVQGDSILKIKYSDETKKIMDEVYSKNKDLSDLFTTFLFKKEPKVHMDVEITKDPMLAGIIKKQLLKKFNAKNSRNSFK